MRLAATPQKRPHRHEARPELTHERVGRVGGDELGGVEGAKTIGRGALMLLASVPLAGLAYLAWYGLDEALGHSLPAQIASVGVGILVGIGAYAAAVWALRIPEARQIRTLLKRT